jgi:thioredoxin 1
VADRVAGTVDVVHVDVDLDPDLAQRYEVHGVPVMVRLEGGREVARLVGYRPEPDVLAFVGGR